MLYSHKNKLYLLLYILVYKNEKWEKGGEEERRNEKVYKQGKKVLTFGNSSGILTKLSLR